MVAGFSTNGAGGAAIVASAAAADLFQRHSAVAYKGIDLGRLFFRRPARTRDYVSSADICVRSAILCNFSQLVVTRGRSSSW